MSESLLKQYMNNAESKEHFSGVVMVVKHENVLLHQSYGMATLHEKNNQNTIFHIASITKQFTAAAILKIWHAGDLDLHATINKYLPKKFQFNEWETITVHHLLSHTSGIVDYDEKYYNPATLGFVFNETVVTMIQELAQKKLEFAPGTQWKYCNIGYTILGAILEHQTGIVYQDFIQNYFLNPLKMSSTSFHTEHYVAKKNHALGFRWDEERKKFVEDTYEKIVGTIPDGGMLSTTQDLYTWSRVVAGKRPAILDEEIVKRMTTPVPNTQSSHGFYGYGLGIDDSLGTRKIYHDGLMGGFVSSFCLYSENDLFIGVLCNNTTVDTTKICVDLEQIVKEN